MKYNRLSRIFSRIAMIGVSESDSEELKLQKSLLVISAIPFILAGLIWGTMYINFGELTAGLIPIFYGVFSSISIVIFGLTHKFQIFRFSQLLLILLLPFALMLALGGFVSGSVIILWSIISPLGALLFDKKSNAYWWLIAFVSLVIISIIINPRLAVHNHLTDAQINLFFVINLIAVSSLTFMMVYYFVGRRNYYQERSESLLLNILPKEIAEELKTKGQTDARHFDMVTVMFTDFKNFTNISEKLSPVDLVAEIDTCFKAFDNIIIRHNIEKIKTIGDSYMCAGGLPVPNLTNAVDVVNAALEIQQFMYKHLEERKREGKVIFEMRVGIHTGPVVAGIVGLRKFAYDIWGDTVNLASRMESSGEAGKVNISGSTYQYVSDKFNCTYRGKIQAKNKGEIDMYFVDYHKKIV